MANYVANRLIARGDRASVQRLIETAQHSLNEHEAVMYAEAPGEVTPLSFWSFVPVPPEAHAKYFTEANARTTDPLNWYNWNIANWGTKWDALDVVRSCARSGRSVTYTFTTTWDPPRPVLAAIFAQFPMLDFDFEYRVESEAPRRLRAASGVIVPTATK